MMNLGYPALPGASTVIDNVNAVRLGTLEAIASVKSPVETPFK
jgi:hypothetical protein